jgi:hypothetical protein
MELFDIAQLVRVRIVASINPISEHIHRIVGS